MNARDETAPVGGAAAPLLLDDKLAASLLGLSARGFDEIKDEPYMPKPVVLSPRVRRWVREELLQVPARMPRAAVAVKAEPDHLALARTPEARRARIERAKATGNLSAQEVTT